MQTRNPKQCRERWHNHLDTGLKKGKWTPEEDEIILHSQHQLGNQWASITKNLIGRRDNDVKNRFHRLQRAIRKAQPITGVKRKIDYQQVTIENLKTLQSQRTLEEKQVTEVSDFPLKIKRCNLFSAPNAMISEINSDSNTEITEELYATVSSNPCTNVSSFPLSVPSFHSQQHYEQKKFQNMDFTSSNTYCDRRYDTPLLPKRLTHLQDHDQYNYNNINNFTTIELQHQQQQQQQQNAPMQYYYPSVSSKTFYSYESTSTATSLPAAAAAAATAAVVLLPLSRHTSTPSGQQQQQQSPHTAYFPLFSR